MDLKKSRLRYLKYFGPGAILASMTIGAGNIVLAPRVGAWAVPLYSSLWIVTFAMFSKGFIAYMATRYTLLSGEHIMDLFARFKPKGWINFISLIILVLLLPFMIATFLTILGNAVALFTNIGNYFIWGVSIGLFFAFLGLIGTYELLQKIQLVFALFLAFGAIVAIVIVKPNFLDIFINSINIQIPKVATWVTSEDILAVPVLMQLGAVYGTMNGVYFDFTAYFTWWRLKTKNKKLSLKSEEFTGMKVDLLLSLIIVAIFTISFMAAGALILGGKQIVPNGIDLISAQQNIYSSINVIVGDIIFPVAIFVVIGGTIYAGLDGIPRIIKVWSNPLSKKIKDMKFKRFQGYIVLYLLLTSVPLMLYQSPILLMTVYLLVAGVFAMWLLGWGALYANQKYLPEEKRFSTPSFALMFFANIATTIFIIAIFLVN
jgi:Mn2+/Fe2+ NRAMP family transporter